MARVEKREKWELSLFLRQIMKRKKKKRQRNDYVRGRRKSCRM